MLCSLYQLKQKEINHQWTFIYKNNPNLKSLTGGRLQGGLTATWLYTLVQKPEKKPKI